MWKSIYKTLPKVGKLVLFRNSQGEVFTGKLTEDNLFVNNGGTKLEAIIAWKAL